MSTHEQKYKKAIIEFTRSNSYGLNKISEMMIIMHSHCARNCECWMANTLRLRCILCTPWHAYIIYNSLNFVRIFCMCKWTNLPANDETSHLVPDQCRLFYAYILFGYSFTINNIECVSYCKRVLRYQQLPAEHHIFVLLVLINCRAKMSKKKLKKKELVIYPLVATKCASWLISVAFAFALYLPLSGHPLYMDCVIAAPA